MMDASKLLGLGGCVIGKEYRDPSPQLCPGIELVFAKKCSKRTQPIGASHSGQCKRWPMAYGGHFQDQNQCGEW